MIGILHVWRHASDFSARARVVLLSAALLCAGVFPGQSGAQAPGSKLPHELRAQWVFHASNSNSLEVTPVVFDGLMFVTSANDAFALDAQTGRSIWHYSRPVTEGLIDDAAQHHNRGVAILGARIYMETDNAHLLCLDARSGHLLWDVPYVEGNKNYGATSAPLIVKGKVLVGTSGGDDGVRGFVAAYDADTGKLAWRLWTIPGPG